MDLAIMGPHFITFGSWINIESQPQDPKMVNALPLSFASLAFLWRMKLKKTGGVCSLLFPRAQTRTQRGSSDNPTRLEFSPANSYNPADPFTADSVERFSQKANIFCCKPNGGNWSRPTFWSSQPVITLRAS
jgi:hypothetical protein